MFPQQILLGWSGMRSFVMILIITTFFPSYFLHATPSNQDNFQLAFGIMVYQKNDQSPNQVLESFFRLYETIYHPNKHIYVIHLDIKSDPIIHHEIEKICSNATNCIKIFSRNIAWGSLSTGEMMLALMQEAYESEVSWSYFVLLGHESLPIVSLQRMEQVLQAYPSGTNFINCWNVEGYNFYGQHERNHNRLIELHVDNFAGTLLPIERITRTPPNDIVFYKSLQQMILSSEFVNYAIYGPLTKRIMLYLANVKTSDEMLFPTILQAHEKFAQTAKCDTTLQYSHWIRPGGSWHPEYLTLEHLPIFVESNSTSLIVRKIETQVSSSLIQALQYIRDSTRQVNPRIERFQSQESNIPSISVFDQSYEKENWFSWLHPMTIHYYISLLQEFLMSLTPPSDSSPSPSPHHNHNHNLSQSNLPQLNETGKTYNYRLTCCDWINQQQRQELQQERQQQVGVEVEVMEEKEREKEEEFKSSSLGSKIICRDCSKRNNFNEFHSDLNLLNSLSHHLPWEDICVGLVCGKISPIYITASTHLKRWHEMKPTVSELLFSLNELREVRDKIEKVKYWNLIKRKKEEQQNKK